MIDILELKNKIKSRTTIDDLILAIIYKVNSSDIVSKSDARFQKAFFSMRQQCHGLLDSISFDCSSYTPYSAELDEALFRLETSTALSTLNPRYQDYSIAGKAALYAEAYNKFCQEDRKTIDILGDQLQKILASEE